MLLPAGLSGEKLVVLERVGVHGKAQTMHLRHKCRVGLPRVLHVVETLLEPEKGVHDSLRAGSDSAQKLAHFAPHGRILVVRKQEYKRKVTQVGESLECIKAERLDNDRDAILALLNCVEIIGDKDFVQEGHHVSVIGIIFDFEVEAEGSTGWSGSFILL